MLVCGIGLNRRKELVTLSLGTVALITRDKALIAGKNHFMTSSPTNVDTAHLIFSDRV